MNDTQAFATQVRLDVLRMTSRSGASHVASAFSVTDILAVLYGTPILRYRPTEPRWPGRDRFLLSKGHAGAAVYATLAHAEFFSRDVLDTHYQDGSVLSGHVSHKGVPGVELSTGSLGHGLGVGAGMAMALRGAPDSPRVFVVMSDGECDEGSVWEAAMFASHHRLNRLCAVVDYNKIQSLGPVAETLALEPFADKWRAFGWTVREVDGHDHAQLADAFRDTHSDHPVVVIAHTVKGKGVSFMEHSVLWHYRAPRGEEFEQARIELEAGLRRA